MHSRRPRRDELHSLVRGLERRLLSQLAATNHRRLLDFCTQLQVGWRWAAALGAAGGGGARCCGAALGSGFRALQSARKMASRA